MSSNTIRLDSLFTEKFEKKGNDYIIRLPANECDLSLFDPTSPVEVTIRQENGYSQGQSPEQQPVSEGDTIDLEVEELGRHGDGIAFVNGNFVVFVPESDVGDSVTVEIDEVTSNFAQGRVVEKQSKYLTKLDE